MKQTSLEKNRCLAACLLVCFVVCAVISLSTMEANAADNPLNSKCQTVCEPTNMLVCRLANYKQYKEAAFEHLSSIGIKYVFMNVPSPEEVDDVLAKMKKAGLQVVVVRGETDFSKPACLKEIDVQLATAEKMGIHYMFVSPKLHGAKKEVLYGNLRKAGDLAKKHDVTITLETHPGLGKNAAMHLETMKAIHHPNVRVNFDTANLLYYNKNCDPVAELEKIIDYVATVEVKDSNGKFETWYFPTLGEGVVDIPGILRVLRKHDYRGPITMEVEGIKGVTWDKAKILEVIEKSARYMRSLGHFD